MASIIICSIPKHSVNVPPLSLGFLQASCKKYGIETQIRDFNYDLWKQTIYDDKWYDVWLETNQTLFKGKAFKQFCKEKGANIPPKCCERLITNYHKHLISVITAKGDQTRH